MELYRQGDVLIVKIEKLPNFTRMMNSDIIVEGEATGHAHRLKNGWLYTDGRDLFISAQADTEIVHEEHDTIPLDAGLYKVIRQREYIPVDPKTKGQFNINEDNNDQRLKKYRYVMD
ncbi:MAG: hypothetical protein GF364_13490 [Candidatus Lokiarchaeota archaeon]|nr:hypothetical protein [Candidatus Lokiarchaeota archaeon]